MTEFKRSTKPSETGLFPLFVILYVVSLSRPTDFTAIFLSFMASGVWCKEEKGKERTFGPPSCFFFPFANIGEWKLGKTCALLF